MTKDMTKGSPVKHILLFSIPLLIGNVFQQFYSMVDTIIVGRFVGVDALAAVGATGSLVFLINGFALGLTSGFSVMVSQRFGANDEKGLRKAVSSSVVLCTALVVLLTTISLMAAKPLLHLMNTPENIFNDAYTYVFIIFAGIITTVAYNMMASILRALGDSKSPLYFLIISSVLNIILDLVLIINFNMGVAGAAYATIFSQGVSALLCFVYILKKYTILKLKREDYDVKKSMYVKHLKIGIPMALQFSITALGLVTVQGALNPLGSTFIAAYTASSKALQLVMQPAVTYGVTMATYCAQNLGAKRYDRIKDGVNKAIIISIITSIIAGAALILFGTQFVKLFIENPDASIISASKQVLDISGIFFIPLGLIFIYRNALQGIGESFVPMMAGVAELGARALVAFTLPAYWGFFGICVADPFAWIAASVPLALYYHSTIKKLLAQNSQLAEITA